MKQKFLIFITALTFGVTPTIARANNSVMDEISNQNGYSWSLSDENQVTQMKGMILWGFFIAIASAVLTIVIPHSTAPTTTTGKPANQGSHLF